jgi:GT2 family glycosyltransferase
MQNTTTKLLIDEPRVFAVMPTYNRWDEARVSIGCLLKSDYRNLRIVLVEDGCTDGTVEKCRAEFPEVEILHGDGDLWWSGATNMGTRHALEAGAELVLWINDDVRAEPQTLGSLVESHLRCGEKSVVCARILQPGAGEREWRGEPPTWHPEAKSWRAPEMPADGDLKIEHPPGGQGVLIPANCFRQIGLVDARAFPHYWADHDFHYRAMKSGYRYFIATQAVVLNRPNKERPEAGKLFDSWRAAWWFLTNRRSAMNVPTVRRLLKRHLPAREYRKIFYPMLARHLAWLSYGWLTRKPALHKPLRLAKRAIQRERA